MPLTVVYDLTRLTSRIVNATPNGIDRVDHAFADHLFGDDSNHLGFGLFPWGQRVIPAGNAKLLTRAIAQGWGETGADEDFVTGKIGEFLGEIANPNRSAGAQRIRIPKPGRLRGVLGLPGLAGFPGLSPRTAVPTGAVYLNVSQFPLWFSPYFRWLRDRPDIAVAVMIHDLLPLEYPEYFRPGEYERHKGRLAFVAERAAMAIVSTEQTKKSLLAYLAKLGRSHMPVHVGALPASSTFSQPPTAPDPSLRKRPYFIVCGTIEPRKNHLLLLQIWREMVAAHGDQAPKLLVIGKRGWENEGAVDMLERCRAIERHVIEVSGLSSVTLRRLMDNARAMLVPSFCEGYGLPVAEALAAGVPLIASNLPIFREIGGEDATYLDPLDGPAWRREILARSSEPPAREISRRSGSTWTDYFTGLETFLDAACSSSG